MWRKEALLRVLILLCPDSCLLESPVIGCVHSELCCGLGDQQGAIGRLSSASGERMYLWQFHIFALFFRDRVFP